MINKTITIPFIFFLILIISNSALAQKTSDKSGMEEERRQIQQELQQIEQAYNAVKGMSKENLSQLAALNRKIELQEKYINNIGKEVRLLDDDIYYSAIEIKRLKNQLDTLKSHYARTVVYAYKNRSNYDHLNFIFSANSFNDAVKRVSYLKSYRNYRQKQMGDILKTRDLIAKRYDHQLSTKDKKKLALDSKETEFIVLERQRGEKDSVAHTLTSQAGDLQKQIARKKKRDAELRSSIAAVVRKEIAEARKIAQEEARAKAAADAKQRSDAMARQIAESEKNALNNVKGVAANTPPVSNNVPDKTPVAPQQPRELPKSSTVSSGATIKAREVPKTDNQPLVADKTIAVNRPVPQATVQNKPPEGGYLNYQADDIALNADFSQNKGKLPHPVDGVITLGFGRYKIEGLGPDIIGDNPGVTYTTSVGAPVKAVFGGEVVSISNVGGMSFVVIRHGKYFTAYSNLSSVSVSKGATVNRGQTLGKVGADEETGSGKLDFILMIEERNVDPRSWLQ
ncbi:MAG: murein hydrolase activator EnvC family protein [Niabella sp.]